jgi:uroporphyrin-III C-methyltransferase
LSAETPIALVRWGTRPEQEESIATLGTIVEQVEAAGFAAPEIAVIGNVVNLHGLLSGCRPVYQTVE